MFILKMVYGVATQLAIFGLLLFAPAGTLAWPRAWTFIFSVVVATVATMLYLRNHEDLLNERLKGPIQPGQPLSDKIVLNLFLATLAGVVIFIPLDVFRLHLTGEPGILISVLGFPLFAVGWWVEVLALRENDFAAGVVKHQERQRVIDSGVYAVVRHPMYSGFLPLMVGMCLWLGSYAAVLLAIVPIGMIGVRIVVEERFLRRELAGYGAYTERIRYRLIPFVW